MIRYILVMISRISIKLFRQKYIIIKIVLKKYINLVKKIRNTITIKQLLDIISSLTFISIGYPKISIAK